MGEIDVLSGSEEYASTKNAGVERIAKGAVRSASGSHRCRVAYDRSLTVRVLPPDTAGPLLEMRLRSGVSDSEPGQAISRGA